MDLTTEAELETTKVSLLHMIFERQVAHPWPFAGNLLDWWSEETAENYKKRAQCIIDQYGNYTAGQIGLNLNGINTQGENIADNGGVKESYLAYSKTILIFFIFHKVL